jgi:hypothetical protein
MVVEKQTSSDILLLILPTNVVTRDVEERKKENWLILSFKTGSATSKTVANITSARRVI